MEEGRDERKKKLKRGMEIELLQMGRRFKSWKDLGGMGEIGDKNKNEAMQCTTPHDKCNH